MQDDLDGDDSMVREDEEGGEAFDEIERYLRDVGNNGGHRAKTAPLKAGKHAE
jgi:hypothetical protein